VAPRAVAFLPGVSATWTERTRPGPSPSIRDFGARTAADLGALAPDGPRPT
jgi:hypothetical protein